MDRSELDQWSMAPPQGQADPTRAGPGVANKISKRAGRTRSSRRSAGDQAQGAIPDIAGAKKLTGATKRASSKATGPKLGLPGSTKQAAGSNVKNGGSGGIGGKAAGAAKAAAGKTAGKAATKAATKAAGSAAAQAAGGLAAGAATGGVSLVAQVGINAAKKAASVVTSRVKARAQAKATGRKARDIRKENRGPVAKLLIAGIMAVLMLAGLFFFIIILSATNSHPTFQSPGNTLTSTLLQQDQAPTLWIQDAVQAGQDTATPWPILLSIGYATTDWGQVNPYGGNATSGSSIGQLGSTIEGAGPMLLSQQFVGNTWPSKPSTAMDGDPLKAMEALGRALAVTGQQAAADYNVAYGNIVNDPFGTGGAAPNASANNPQKPSPDPSSNNMKAWIEAVQNLQPDIEPGACQAMAGGGPSPAYIYQCGQSPGNKGAPPVLDWTTYGKPANPQGVAQTDFASMVVTQEAPLLAGFNSPSTNVPGLGVTVGSNGTLTVPPNLLPIFQAAAATCPGLQWTLLAADAYAESRWNVNAFRPGSISADGQPSYGIAQMEMATFQEYDKPVPADTAPNPPQATPLQPQNPWAAEFAAARLLCSDGVATNPQAALGGYNAGTPNTWDTSYIDTVLQFQANIQAGLALQGAPVKATSPQLVQLLTFAIHVIGTPYVWGGTGAASGGFDCSGLTQAAAASAGINIQRTSEAQWKTLPHTTTPTPGDLVFFDFTSDSQPSPNHVGIYIGNNEMIDAPQPGQDVKVDPIWTANLVGYAIP